MEIIADYPSDDDLRPSGSPSLVVASKAEVVRHSSSAIELTGSAASPRSAARSVLRTLEESQSSYFDMAPTVSYCFMIVPSYENICYEVPPSPLRRDLPLPSLSTTVPVPSISVVDGSDGLPRIVFLEGKEEEEILAEGHHQQEDEHSGAEADATLVALKVTRPVAEKLSYAADKLGPISVKRSLEAEIDRAERDEEKERKRKKSEEAEKIKLAREKEKLLKALEAEREEWDGNGAPAWRQELRGKWADALMSGIADAANYPKEDQTHMWPTRPAQVKPGEKWLDRQKLMLVDMPLYRLQMTVERRARILKASRGGRQNFLVSEEYTRTEWFVKRAPMTGYPSRKEVRAVFILLSRLRRAGESFLPDCAFPSGVLSGPVAWHQRSLMHHGLRSPAPDAHPLGPDRGLGTASGAPGQRVPGGALPGQSQHSRAQAHLPRRVQRSSGAAGLRHTRL